MIPPAGLLSHLKDTLSHSHNGKQRGEDKEGRGTGRGDCFGTWTYNWWWCNNPSYTFNLNCAPWRGKLGSLWNAGYLTINSVKGHWAVTVMMRKRPIKLTRKWEGGGKLKVKGHNVSCRIKIRSDEWHYDYIFITSLPLLLELVL